MMRALLLLLLAAPLPAQAALTQAQLDRVVAAPPPGARLDLGADLPAVVVFVDFDCGALCDAVLAQTGQTLAESGLAPGEDFTLVAIGIDPRDDARRAADMVAAQVPAALAGATRILQPDADRLEQITAALGYGYAYDAANDRFAHPAARYVLDASGRVMRVLPAFRADPGDLRLALVEAAEGRSGGLRDRLALLCYGFDPASGRYSLAIRRILMTLSLVFAALMATAIAALVIREKRKEAP